MKTDSISPESLFQRRRFASKQPARLVYNTGTSFLCWKQRNELLGLCQH